VGNRLLRTTSAGALEASVYDANDRLLEDGTGASYAYDANGNLVAKGDASGITTYAWDAKDRLIRVSGPGVGMVEHRYDWAGDRIETRVDGEITR
jgi:YD repeat-containing protein